MLENDELTFVEEGEDILDGLEMTVNDGEIPEDLLLDSTEIVPLERPEHFESWRQGRRE